MTKVVPLGGKHKSVKSFLAEMMGREDLGAVIVFAFTNDGDMIWGHYEVTRERMAYAGANMLQSSVAADED
jgi:hypothetical protein